MKQLHFRKKSYLFILLGIWLVMILSIVGLYGVFWTNIINIYRSRTDEFEENFLTQTRNAIDITMGQIDESLQQLLMDQRLEKFAEYPRGQYYEELTGSIEDVNKTQLFYYLDAKSDLLSLLASKAISNDYILSIYYYDTKKDMFFTNSGGQYYRSKFPDVACNGYIQQVEGNVLGRDIKGIRSESDFNNGKTILSIVYYYTQNSGTTNLIIVNLDVLLLSEDIFSGLSWRDESAIYVISDDNGVIISNQTSTIGMSLTQLEDAADLDIQSRGGKLIIATTESDQVVNQIKLLSTDWHIVSTARSSGIYQDMGSIHLMIILTAALAFVVSSVVALFIARRMFRPVRAILERIEQGSDEADLKTDEFEEIIMFVEQSRSQQVILQQRLSQSLPAYRETVLRGLLQGRIIQPEQQEQVFDMVEIKMGSEPVTVVVVGRSQIDDATCKELSERIAQDYLCYVLMNLEGQMVLCLNISAERRQKFRELLQALGIQYNVRFGLAEPVPIAQIAEAYQQAKLAVHALTTRDQYGCLSFNKVHENVQLINLMLSDRMELLERTLRAGDVDQALSIYDYFIEKIERNLSAMSIFQVRHEMMKIGTSIFNAMPYYLLDDELDLLYKRTTDMLGSASFTRMKETLRALITHHMKESSGLSSSEPDDYVTRACHIIGKDYSRDISLQDVAGILGITPEYLSQLFKKQTGQNFIEYLTDVRIGKAKELLLDPVNKVQDVAHMVGYQNTDYFIRVFKRCTGLTPGKFRRQAEK